MLGKAYYRIAIYFLIVVIVAIILPLNGCFNEQDSIMSPGHKEHSSIEEIGYGKLHNEIMKEYLIIAYNDNLFKKYSDNDWRIPWKDAKKAIFVAYNRVMKKYDLPTINKEKLEMLMSQMAELSREGKIDLFHPETITQDCIMRAANEGYIDKEIADGLYSAINMLKDDNRQITLQNGSGLNELKKNNFSVDILVHSMAFWKEVQGKEVFLKKDDDDGDSVWDDVKKWWNDHKVQIREVFVGGCDAVGGVVGSAGGPAGAVAGAVLGTAAGTTIWPPYNGGQNAGGSGDEK